MKKARQAAPKKMGTKKEKSKKHLFHSVEQFIGFLFFMLVISVSCWIIYTMVNWMDNPERVVLSQLTVTGDRQFTTDEDIQHAILSLGLPDTFIGQDVDIIQQEVMRLSWIKQVSVRKQWPDKLVVNVVEFQPQFFWNDVFLLDSDGIVFSLPLERINNHLFPLLYGPEGKEKSTLDMYQRLNGLLTNRTMNNKLDLVIAAISTDERYSWQVMVKQPCANDSLDDIVACAQYETTKVILGREDLDERFKRFIELYPEIQAQTAPQERITTIDLRYSNGIAVQRDKIN